MKRGHVVEGRFEPYKEIVFAMLRTGVFGYGGGPAIIPLFRHEAVTRYHWVDDAEFGEILAFANVLPGPVATKMSVYLGYHRKGVPGALVAVLTHILPSTIAMIALFGVYAVLKHSKVVQGMMAAVSPVVAVMLGVMAYEFVKKAWKGLGGVWAVVFGVIAFVLLKIVHLNAGILVLLFLAYGSVHLSLRNKLARPSSSKEPSDDDKGASK